MAITDLSHAHARYRRQDEAASRAAVLSILSEALANPVVPKGPEPGPTTLVNEAPAAAPSIPAETTKEEPPAPLDQGPSPITSTTSSTPSSTSATWSSITLSTSLATSKKIVTDQIDKATPEVLTIYQTVTVTASS